jgi:tripartite-type tricarboxylate transporter receptor subunit TctC
MRSLNRKTVIGLVIGALALMPLMPGALAPSAHAQTYPSKPITLIVPFPPGGTSDTGGRLMAQELSKALGQSVVVENRAGANGNIGSAAVARAPADGYTLLLSGIGSHGINPSLYAKMPYDALKDFTHIVHFTNGPNVLIASSEFPAKTFKEFVDLMKANPGKYNYASSGSGSSGHLAMELLKQQAGLKIDHVPYKGGAPAMTDILGGQVPVMFINQDAPLSYVKAGRMRVLAVASLERNPLYPDVPTIAESGFPGFSAVSWNGLSAPAKTPKDIVDRLNAAIVQAVQTPALKEKLESSGFVVVGGTPEQYAAFIKSEIEKWAPVVKAAGATVD